MSPVTALHHAWILLWVIFDVWSVREADNGAVLDQSDTPMPGLFAAGSTVGGWTADRTLVTSAD